MKSHLFSQLLVLFLLTNISCKNSSDEFRTIKPEVLKDKIAGGWAGKMIGVTYGAPTEFRAKSQTYEDSIKWKPSDIKGSIWQDDQLSIKLLQRKVIHINFHSKNNT